MRDFRLSWSDVADRIRSSPSILVLAEFDGTLVGPSPRPDEVHVRDQTRKLLRRLAQHPRAAAGVVSGRSLVDLRSRVGVVGLWYVGNHGDEIRMPGGIDLRFFDSRGLRSLELFEKDLAKATASIPGTVLEPRGPILALHCGEVEPGRVPEVERVFVEVLESHHERIGMARDGSTLEARLRAPCTKASAIRQIRKDTPASALPIYFGDDRADHDPFRELRGSGVTVSVGEGEAPLAHYALPDPASVLESLGSILSVLDKT